MFNHLGIYFNLIAISKKTICYFVILIIGLLSTSNHVLAAGESWLTGYTYRKAITVTGSNAGLQTDYQIKIIINEGSGTDTASTVYLSNHALASFNDLRFTQSDGNTLLDYWIESNSSGVATVWIECNSIPQSPSTATFYLYYGNSSASSASNGANTFPFYDDFNDNSVDSNLWTVASSGSATYSESGNSAKVSGTSSGTWVLSYFRTKTAFGSGYAVRSRQYYTLNSGNFCSYSGFADNTHTSCFDLNNSVVLTNNQFNWSGIDHSLHSIVNTVDTSQAAASQTSSWKIFEYRRYTDNAQIMYDDTSAAAVTNSANIPTANLYAGLWANAGSGGSGSIEADWFLVRKYVNPEPSIAFGVESTEPQGYVITNPPSSTQITLASDWNTDVTNSVQTGTKTIGITKDSYRVASFDVDFSANRDWTNLTIESNGAKALLHYQGGFTSIPGHSGTSFSLYIPDKGGSRVRICPNANSLNEVIDGCSGEYFLTASANNVTKINEDGIDYWIVSGLTSTGGEDEGGGSYSAPLFTDFTFYLTIILTIIGGSIILQKQVKIFSLE
ncbi:DUF2341 domain-containing protein [Candidatus Beckwithbacteria bacterium]|nr:DUF2341 domain-containing protein [Candidatus Beckwithbacteria bacterium]